MRRAGSAAAALARRGHSAPRNRAGEASVPPAAAEEPFLAAMALLGAGSPRQAALWQALDASPHAATPGVLSFPLHVP